MLSRGLALVTESVINNCVSDRALVSTQEVIVIIGVFMSLIVGETFLATIIVLQTLHNIFCLR